MAAEGRDLLKYVFNHQWRLIALYLIITINVSFGGVPYEDKDDDDDDGDGEGGLFPIL